MKLQHWTALLACAFPLPTTFAWDWVIDWDRVHRIGEVLVEEFAPPDWQELWQTVHQSLRTGDLVDLAWLRPEVEATLHFLNQFEETQIYADWLRQRWDYIDVAHDVVASHAPEAHRRPPPPPDRVEDYSPPPRPAPATPVPPDRNREMQARASSQALLF